MLADENLPQKGLYHPKNKDSCKIHSASRLLGESVKNSVLFCIQSAGGSGWYKQQTTNKWSTITMLNI